MIGLIAILLPSAAGPPGSVAFERLAGNRVRVSIPYRTKTYPGEAQAMIRAKAERLCGGAERAAPAGPEMEIRIARNDPDRKYGDVRMVAVFRCLPAGGRR